MVPDFVRAGAVVNGIEEQVLRDHLVMHSARLDEKLKQEIFDIVRAKALRRDKIKGKGKEKGKDKGKFKDNGKKDSHDADASRPRRRRRNALIAGSSATRSRRAGSSQQTRLSQPLKASRSISTSQEPRVRVLHELLHSRFQRRVQIQKNTSASGCWHLCAHSRLEAPSSSCLCVSTKLCGRQREPFLLGPEAAQREWGRGGAFRCSQRSDTAGEPSVNIEVAAGGPIASLGLEVLAGPLRALVLGSLTRCHGDGRRTLAGPQSSRRSHLATGE